MLVIRMYCESRPDIYVYKCRLNFLEAVRIWEVRHVYPDGGDPDGNACHVSPWGAWHVFSGGGVPTVLTPQCPTWWLHILLSNDKRSDRSHSYLYTFSHPSLAFSPSIFSLNFLIIICHDFFLINILWNMSIRWINLLFKINENKYMLKLMKMNISDKFTK